MSATAIVAIIQALIAGVPKLVELIRSGRKPGSIKLGEFISTDALETLEGAKQDAQDYIKNG